MEFLTNNPMLIVLLGLLVVMMVMSSRGRKKMMEQQAERERTLTESLVPGAWVKTGVGLWGRYVDTDGDIIILETADGTEMYWERSMIREVGEPPFAPDLDAANEVDSFDEDEHVLGLDADSDPSGKDSTGENKL